MQAICQMHVTGAKSENLVRDIGIDEVWEIIDQESGIFYYYPSFSSLVKEVHELVQRRSRRAMNCNAHPGMLVISSPTTACRYQLGAVGLKVPWGEPLSGGANSSRRCLSIIVSCSAFDGFLTNDGNMMNESCGFGDLNPSFHHSPRGRFHAEAQKADPILSSPILGLLDAFPTSKQQANLTGLVFLSPHGF